MFDRTLWRSLVERGMSAALVLLVGAMGGDAVNLFQLDWAQIGVAALGAAVLEVARGLLASTGVVGDKGSPALVKEQPRS